MSTHHPLHNGPYYRSREVLDYTWHVHYPVERQLLQDEIIHDVLSTGRGCTCARPWIVFTAGAMGCGKSYAMRNLYHRRLFPLDRFVLVDPDRLKRQLPEMSGYMREHPHMAATLTHKESGYIAEIVQREAMLRHRNVLVDGSLRNVAWYTGYFQRIRRDFPSYRIAIILVTAPPDRVIARAARRAAVTGRVVPPEVLQETMEQVPQSFTALAPLANFTAVLQNDDDAADPRLMPPMDEATFARTWWRTCDVHPEHAAPQHPP